MTALLLLFLPLALHLACSEPDPRNEDWSQHYQAGRTALGQSRFTEAAPLCDRAAADSLAQRARALAASPASDPDQVGAALADLLARKTASDHP